MQTGDSHHANNNYPLTHPFLHLVYENATKQVPIHLPLLLRQTED